MKNIYFLIVSIFVLLACGNEENVIESKFDYVDRVPIMDTIFDVQADFETEPIEASSSSDAADDPAIWIHPY